MAGIEDVYNAVKELSDWKSYAVDKNDTIYYYFAEYKSDGSWRIQRQNKITMISDYIEGSGDVETNWNQRKDLIYKN
jgi:hypothetical protein